MEYLEAVERAKRNLSFSFAEGKESPFAFFEERHAAKAITPAANADDIAQILEWAEGDADVFDALKRGIGAALKFDALMRVAAPSSENPQPLHLDVVLWLAKYLRGQVARPLKAAGRKKGFERYFIIHSIVKDLVLVGGMTATRNDESEATSACDAVAKALADLDLMPRSYDRVKHIWLLGNKEPFGSNLTLVERRGKQD